MKVTVCFGPVSVVVPCGNGDILVRDLISQAVTRYKKASNKSNDATISVAALRSSDGAILDPDDRLADVVDDREQLAACLDADDADRRSMGGLNVRGDGTSASSGSPSPDFLHRERYLLTRHGQRKDMIEVTGQELLASSADLLHVRRGSEPALNRLSPISGSVLSVAQASGQVNVLHPDYKQQQQQQRWPADASGSESEAEPEPVVRRQPSGRPFARSGARVSMQIFGAGGRWAEAADNALLNSATLPASSSSAVTPPDYEETMHRRTRSLRREPVGATSESMPLTDGQQVSSSAHGQLVVLPNEGGPLGIHVVPDYSTASGNAGEPSGLRVQGVEPGGRISRDGRIQVHDRIVEINGHPLKDVPFPRAQELFRNALQSRDLRLRIVKPSSEQQQHDIEERHDQQQSTTTGQQQQTSGPATVSPSRKPVPGTGRAASALMTVSTRKIGKKLDIELTKGSDGLGFSVTTRDNPAGGLCPIYIKNILPRGAAIEDGRLRSGDRLLEVNGIEVTGKQQSEVVTMLRNIPLNGLARLLVARQDAEEDTSTNQAVQHPTTAGQSSPKLPRQIKTLSRESQESLLMAPWKQQQREIITLDVPVHDTEKAGLGISVKGKTTPQMGDTGIFIKSVLHGGAASRDGRLRNNDQLLQVNGVSLQGRSNTEAMEALRRAVHQEGPKPGHITLTVARRIQPTVREAEGQADDSNATVRLGSGLDASNLNDHSAGSSDQSGSTVIFVSGSGSKNGLSDLRNESYYRATHETWNTTQLQESIKSTLGPGRRQHSQNSPTVQLTPGEVVSIDGDYMPQRLNSSGTSDNLDASWRYGTRSGPVDGRDKPWNEPAHSPCSDRPSDSDAPTYASQTSLEDPNTPGFSRDQFGRQSMSEKRHASLDAKSTDTYQRNKKLREEREKQKQQETEVIQQQQQQQQQQQPQQQHQKQSTKENVPPSGRVIRRAIKRRHAHPLVSRLEKDYLSSPPFHRSSPNLYQPDGGVVSVRRIGMPPLDGRGSRLSMAPSVQTLDSRSRSRLSMAPSLMTVAGYPSSRVPSVDSLPPNHQRSTSAHHFHHQRSSSVTQRQSTPNTKHYRAKSSSHESRQLFVRPAPPPTRDVGPTLGLKKSSSLESLQTVVQEIQMQDEEPVVGCYGYHRPTAIRVVRGRGCNESFRAAVDRSYDDQGQEINKEPMETLDEEIPDPSEPLQPINIDEQPFNNKTETRKSKKKNANAAGLLLKGLGSMFRFGKHRKSAPSSPEQAAINEYAISSAPASASAVHPATQYHGERRQSASGSQQSRPSDVDRHHVLRRTLPPDERDRAELGRQMALAVARHQDEQKRIQQHYQRLMDQQQQQQQRHGQQQQNQEDPAVRSQRLHQLRAQHQKRHAEQQQQQHHHHQQHQRQSTQTPTEHFDSNKNGAEVSHGRSASYDPYNDVRKPRSRAAVGEPNTLMPISAVTSSQGFNNNHDDFALKSGTLNAVEIREMQELVRMQRLKVEGQVIRRQQHYHSQRSAREARMSPPNQSTNWTDRPVSNYFEYESLHIAGHTVAMHGPPYRPQQMAPPTSRRPPPNDDTTYFRRPTEYSGNPVRASMYGGMPTNYTGSSGQRPPPLAGSKV